MSGVRADVEAAFDERGDASLPDWALAALVGGSAILGGAAGRKIARRNAFSATPNYKRAVNSITSDKQARYIADLARQAKAAGTDKHWVADAEAALRQYSRAKMVGGAGGAALGAGLGGVVAAKYRKKGR